MTKITPPFVELPCPRRRLSAPSSLHQMMKLTALFACGLGLCPSSTTTNVASAFVAPYGVSVRLTNQRASACLTPFSRQHDPPLGSTAAVLSMSSGGNSGEGNGGERGGMASHFAGRVKAAVTAAAIGLALAGPMVSFPGAAEAGGRRSVGEISASGLVFKDKLNVEAFSDPKVKGVTIYLSDFSRPVADKLLNGDIFSDPSSAALFCVRSGPMEVTDGLTTSKEGEELFKEDKSFFKSIVVRRIYDKEANNVVYVSFSSKLDANSDGNKSRFKSSLCALHVE